MANKRVDIMTKERMIRIAYYYINYHFKSLENSLDEWEKSKRYYDIILHRIDSLVPKLMFLNLIHAVICYATNLMNCMRKRIWRIINKHGKQIYSFGH